MTLCLYLNRDAHPDIYIDGQQACSRLRDSSIALPGDRARGSRAARGTGASVLSLQLFARDDGVAGALNVYSDRPDVFGEPAIEAGTLFASHAALACAYSILLFAPASSTALRALRIATAPPVRHRSGRS